MTAAPLSAPLNESAAEKARVLSEALPWMARFSGKTFVIKYGGAAMKDAGLRSDFARDILLMRLVGIRVVVVHGGGPAIDQMLSRLNISSTKVRGMRVTDAATMEVVEMVLGGRINQELVALINQHGGRAVGLSGHDASLLHCEKLMGEDGADLGLVGVPRRVDRGVIDALLDAGLIPVVAPIGVGPDGKSLNINADLVAGALASALGAEKLVLLTDVEGVLDANGTLLRQFPVEAARGAIADGTVGGGMIPKVECCLEAVEAGVRSAHVVDGRKAHTLLLEIFTDGGVGTVLRRE